MSDWGWVSLAYSIVYLSLAAYTMSLLIRRNRLDRDGRSR